MGNLPYTSMGTTMSMMLLFTRSSRIRLKIEIELVGFC